MTVQSRHAYLLSIFEKLGTPLMAAVAEATERDRLIALQQGQKNPEVPDHEEAERIASLLKASAEMGFSLSRQIDLRMLDASAADGVRLTLATIAAPLVANLYRVNGRTPSTADIDRMVGAMQAVTLFADNYNAAADANVRLQIIEQDFGPADNAQVQLMALSALMPAINAVCTFSFGQPEKNLLTDVMNRLNATAQGLHKEFFGQLGERDGLRAEITLLRTAANLYSQVHFTEMSKLMFLDDTERDKVDLNARLADLWGIVDKRLAMLGVLASALASGSSAAARSGAQAPAAPAVQPVAATTAPSVSAPPANKSAPLSSFAAPKAPIDPNAKSNPMSFFGKPKEAAGGEA